MSANVYSIESLLVGKDYYSRTLQGEIVSAEPHPKGIWYQDCETYLVKIRTPHSYKDHYRTIAVKTENL
jgi:hypothetical protein